VGGAELIFDSHCGHQICRQDEGRENVWTLSHRLTVYVLTLALYRMRVLGKE
jgi:hypothetical protein